MALAHAIAPPAVASIKLSGTALAASDVGEVKISPDGRWVVYRHDALSDDKIELWSVPSFGGTPERLNGEIVLGGDVVLFAISSDSRRVVYVAQQVTIGSFEIHSVPIEGGDATTLNDALVLGGDVQQFAISPDSSRVVYMADRDTFQTSELYSVAIGGGAVAELNQSLFGEVWSFAIAPDGGRVVFLAVESEDAELFSVPIGDGEVTKLNGPIAVGVGGGVTNFAIAPDSQRVVYRADQDTLYFEELYSVAITGSDNQQLNDDLLNGEVDRFAVMPDSQSVVFMGDFAANDVVELWSAPIAGGATTKLSGTMISGGDVYHPSEPAFGLAADGGRIVFRADREVNERFELWSALPAGGEPTKLNNLPVTGGDVVQTAGALLLSPAGDRVAFLADGEVDGTDELYGAPIGGGGATKLNAELVGGTDVGGSCRFTPDGAAVVYQAFQTPSVRYRLWSAPSDGSAPAVELNGDLSTFGDVLSFVVGSDGGVAYVADQETDTKGELFAVPRSLFWDDFRSGDPSAWTSVAP